MKTKICAMILGVMAALVGACTSEVVPVQVVRASTGETLTGIDVPTSVWLGFAAYDLGYEDHDGQGDRGFMTIRVHDPNDLSLERGGITRNDRCHIDLWITNHEFAAAQTIGAALGLDPVDDENNIMASPPPPLNIKDIDNYDVSDGQIEDSHDRAAELCACTTRSSC